VNIGVVITEIPRCNMEQSKNQREALT